MDQPSTVGIFSVVVGIDISKETYDACLVDERDKPIYGKFDNNVEGHIKLLKWAKRLAKDQSIHFCMEATGAYSQSVAMYLAEHEQMVSVVNPHKIHHVNLGSGQGNKTDKADAKAIAHYCRSQKPPLWRAAVPEVRELTALVRHLDNLQVHAVQQRNRLMEPGLPDSVTQSLTKLLTQIQAEIDAVEKLIDDHINRHPNLKEDRDLLVSIPGIGEMTAARIIAELPDVSQFASAQSAARYAGLSPRKYESGTSVHKRTKLFQGGKRRLKAALYMPAMTATIWNEPVRRIYERLRDKGHCGASALGAAMRKLIMIAVAVLRTRKPFDPKHVPAIPA